MATKRSKGSKSGNETSGHKTSGNTTSGNTTTGSETAGKAGGQAHAQAPGATIPGTEIPMPDLADMPKIAPDVLQDLQTKYFAQLQKVLSQEGSTEPSRDKRFSNPLWQSFPLYSMTKGLYEANASFLASLADSIEAEPQAKARLKFATQQWIDATSPSNNIFTNPDVQQKLISTQGESLRKGIENFVGDVAKGHISQTDESAFEVGKNLAVTPGAVVYENELFQLIQYSPSTPKVGKRPILMVPPCINKFYILDLQPENSVVAYTVAQGNTVFLLSWRNPGPSLGHLTWDDYIEKGPIEAIRVVQAISGQKQINTLGFCVGGTIIATALAVLAARGEQPAASLTLLTTLLDFSVPGILGIFVDEQQVQMREKTLGGGGILPGKELASTFSALRPNDLIWNYVVNNYMMGEKPAAFDLLYWNGDCTNLPGPMYAWYLRHMYLQNELRVPGAVTCLGESVDLGRIECPVFIYASREDHIVPWEAAYMSTQLLKGDVTFVLGASGHIAGVINPAAKNKRSHWVGSQVAEGKGKNGGAYLPEQHTDWFAHATEKPGSWWPVWSEWLGNFKAGEASAPTHPGAGKYKAIEPAPGRYVKVHADSAE